MIDAVIEELKTHQTQLDMDGVMVGVSRQALEELLAHVAAPAQPAPIAGLEPVAWQMRYSDSNDPWVIAEKVNTTSLIEWRGLVPVEQAQAQAIAAWNARPGDAARETTITEAIQALIDAGDYFSARADVNDGDYGEPSPNREMTLASQCDEALERLEALRARAQMERGK